MRRDRCRPIARRRKVKKQKRPTDHSVRRLRLPSYQRLHVLVRSNEFPRQAPREIIEQARADLRLHLHEPLQVLSRNDRELCIGCGDAVGCSRGTRQHGDFSEHLARPHLDCWERGISERDLNATLDDNEHLVGGIARLNDEPVMVIGHQKGREVREKVRRNFGMPRPEGYRKACRLMEMAERFKLPILTFIDTPGAYPGIDAEERGQSEAIAWNLRVMARLKTPIIATVIGEGGSGGALAIGVCDQLNMLQYSTYSVISPEGCASILWKTAEKAPDAAEAMGITAERLKGLGIVDQVIGEPLGGAHSDPAAAAESVRQALLTQLAMLKTFDTDALLKRRYERLMSYGIA